MIRGAVREAGDRAKVAVYSRERDIDPVGACVGMKGTRVQAIIRELRGEKIDIVEWSDDPVGFVHERAQPGQGAAGIDHLRADRVMEVVVRRQPAVTGDRQEGAERPPRRQARPAGRSTSRARKRSAARSKPSSARSRRRPARRRRGRGRRGRGGDRTETAPWTASAPTGDAAETDAATAEPDAAETAARTSPRDDTITGRREIRARARRTGAMTAPFRGDCWPLSRSSKSRSCSAHPPGGAPAAQAEPRHRAQERVEHRGGDRGPPVRRAARARQRGIELPKGDMFSDAAVKYAKAKTAAPKKGQAPEPPKPRRPARPHG